MVSFVLLNEVTHGVANSVSSGVSSFAASFGGLSFGRILSSLSQNPSLLFIAVALSLLCLVLVSTAVAVLVTKRGGNSLARYDSYLSDRFEGVESKMKAQSIRVSILGRESRSQFGYIKQEILETRRELDFLRAALLEAKLKLNDYRADNVPNLDSNSKAL